MEPKAITAKAVQDALLAGLRLLVVLIAGMTTLFGLFAKRDLSALIAWVQSDGFIVFASAAITAGTAIWGVYKTYTRSHESSTLKTIINDPSTPMADPAAPGDKFTHLTPLVAIPVLMALLMVGGCTTAGNVQLNAGRAFLTAQIAFKSAQQSALTVCTTPAPRLLVPCREAVGVLAVGAKAEAAGFAAQQAGNASDLQTAVTALMDIPPRLAALGILEN